MSRRTIRVLFRNGYFEPLEDVDLPDGARADLLRHWEAIRNAPDVITPDEADALTAEAVAYVHANR